MKSQTHERRDVMARKAREKNTFGTYLIQQSGGGCRKLFMDSKDREKFLSIVRKAKKKFNFRLYAYCLQDDDAYQLIIHDNGSDISKIMKSINISYGMYAVCEGKLFKDRYKSSLINDFPSLFHSIQCVQVPDFKSPSTFDDLIDMDDLLHLVNDDIDTAKHIIKSYFDGDTETTLCDSSKTFCKDDPNCLTCEIDAKNKLLEIAQKKGMTQEEIFKDKKLRNQLIRQFRRESTLSLKALGALFGGLSESSVCKILNQEE